MPCSDSLARVVCAMLLDSAGQWRGILWYRQLGQRPRRRLEFVSLHESLDFLSARANKQGLVPRKKNAEYQHSTMYPQHQAQQQLATSVLWCFGSIG
jgi:hypothetical protein